MMILVKPRVARIETEHQLNKIIKEIKQDGLHAHILFVSLWDNHCNLLVEALEDYDGDDPVYIVNSWDTPHSFVIHSVTKTPTLVSMRGEKVLFEEWLPAIYRRLKIYD